MITTLVLNERSFAEVSEQKGDEAYYADFSNLQTPNFQFLSADQCKATAAATELATELAKLAVIGKTDRNQSKLSFEPDHYNFNPLSWTPTGAAGRVPEAGCGPDTLEDSLLKPGASIQDQARGMHSYFTRCDRSLREEAPRGLIALLKVASTEYDFCDHPNMRRVIVRLANGDVLRGYLALKPGTEKRPLVIAKCGVFCDAGSDSSLRFLMMHLFDESPFNVLAISNVTGANFVADNGFLAIGGFYEGQQIIQLAQLVKQSKLSDRVSSIHVVGASLGSHASLYAAYLSPYNTPAGQPPLIASTLAACPVVDLQLSMRSLFSDPQFTVSTRTWLARKAYNSAARAAISQNPAVAQLFPSADLPNEELPDAVAAMAVEHLKGLRKGWALAPFTNISPSNLAQFWKLNRFNNYATQPLITPTLAFAGDDDKIVPATGNAKELETILARERTPPGTPATDLASMTIPGGNHCAFDIIYGWRTMSTVFRSFVLSHSPEMKGRGHTRLMQIPVDYFAAAANLNTRETHVTQEFKFTKDSANLEISFKIFAPWNSNCSSDNASNPPDTCLRFESASLSLDQLKDLARRSAPHLPTWMHTPITDAEAQAMSRWANVHLTVVDKKGQALDLSTSSPAGLRWNAYDIN